MNFSAQCMLQYDIKIRSGEEWKRENGCWCLQRDSRVTGKCELLLHFVKSDKTGVARCSYLSIIYQGRVIVFSVNWSHPSKKWHFLSPKSPLDFFWGINEPVGYGDPVALVHTAFKRFWNLSHCLMNLQGIKTDRLQKIRNHSQLHN